MIERTKIASGSVRALGCRQCLRSAEMLGWLVNEHAIEPTFRCSTSRPRDEGRSPAKTSPTNRNRSLRLSSGKVLTFYRHSGK